jgi:hypothetical protein
VKEKAPSGSSRDNGVDDYKRKTPDIVMQGIEWEMKSPSGKSKNTIGN